MLILLRRFVPTALLTLCCAIVATAQTTPDIAAIYPPVDTVGGTVSLVGRGFTGTSSITCGGISTSFTILSDSLVRVVLPSASYGFFYLTASSGTAYYSTFTVNSVPAAGSPCLVSFYPLNDTTGGTLTLKGRGFTNVTGVTIGGTAVPSFSVLSDTVIQAVTGTTAMGKVAVSGIFNSAPVSYELEGIYYRNISTYTGPVITSFTPSSDTAGGTVTISGYHFTGANGVSLGSENGGTFQVISPTTIVASVGQPNGTFPFVYVVTPSGRDSLAGWMPNTAPPHIVSFSPTIAGYGTIVTIYGRHFTGMNNVTFGGSSALVNSVVSDSVMWGKVGYGSTGSVLVSGLGGRDSLGGFTYAPQPAITAFSPVKDTTGGTVTITGSHFTAATTVVFGGDTAASLTVVSDSVIKAVVGKAGASGTVQVTTPGGSAASTGQFQYLGVKPRITTFTPTSDSTGGTVTLHGQGLSGLQALFFGSSAAATFQVLSDTVITATIGNGSTGNVWIESRLPDSTLVVDTLASPVFTYLPTAPAIASFSPLSDTSGGTVTLHGTHFTGATAVFFGGDSAASFNIWADTLATAVVGKGASGSVQLVTPAGTGTAATAFTYTLAGPAPKIDSLNQMYALPKGMVAIFGHNFTGVTSVTFGGTPADTFQVYSPSVIGCVVGNGSTGYVRVTTLYGSDSIANFHVITSPSSIIGFTPDTATTGGSVTVYGENLYGVNSITFGGKPGTITYTDLGQVTATVGHGASGNIVLTGGFGTLTDSGFMYTGTYPSVLSFTPAADSAGATVHIHGAKFTGATAVYVGGAAATSFTVTSDTSISAVVPSNVYGKAVTVVTPGGTDSLRGFTYLAPAPAPPVPEVLSFTPVSDTLGGIVTINGVHFTGASAVTFGTTPATSFTVITDSTISAVVPAASGALTVVTAAGSGSSTGSFTFVPWPTPVIHAFTPASDTAGGTVIINGAHFSKVTAVGFGGVPAASFRIVSDTMIEAVVGNGASGAVVVSSAQAGSDTSASGFTFTLPPPPSITSFTPTSDTAGGTVTIYGIGLGGATKVVIGNVPAASFAVLSSTQISAVVASGASTGPIVVYVPGDTLRTAGNFTLLSSIQPKAAVTSFSPQADSTGGTIVVKGTHLAGVTSALLGGTASTFVLQSDSVIWITVGNGSTGPVALIVPGEDTAYSATDFTYLQSTPVPPAQKPQVISFTPTSDTTGGVVTIQGAHFTGATGVYFGTTEAGSFAVVSDSVIAAVVGHGSSGPVTVSTGAGTGRSDTTGQYFTYINVSPPSAPDTFAVTSFTGTIVNSQLQLTWVTRYDENIATYQLQRKTDSSAYTSIYTVNAQRVKGTGINYTFVDHGAVQGNNDYLLSATDTLGHTVGTWQTSETVPQQPHVTALPNPATGSVYVRVPYTVHTAVMELVDLNGKVTRSIAVPTGAYQVRIDLTGVPSGLYILTWQDGTSRTQKTIMVR